jgi:type IV pilus biogenesis protein CpaD/CtpE
MKRFAALVAILALAAPGCASNDTKLHRALLAERLEAMTIITRAEVEAQPVGSAQRAVLALWRAVQFRDAETALELVSPQPNKDQLRSFEDFIVDIGANAAGVTKPTIVSATQTGDQATVVVEFVRHKKVGDQIRTRVTGRLNAQLVHTRDGWLVLWQKAADEIAGAIS